MHPTISEEGQDLSMSSDGEGRGPYQPPPHIAARIFKTVASRRKSSAASSRRNSLTSHHSSRSARSGHGRPPSNHVAQHLRRASIIESRKAKAADRNAHAEQVRLRAAMNKAAPRATTANSVERALAAQKARERYLAQVRANCAEEVRRSKRVAEEQREKRAAEHLKLKEEMEERHAEAEKRKNLLQINQRRPRTATNPAADDSNGPKGRSTYTWKATTPAQAACMIQRAWRRRRWRLIVRDFSQLDLNLDDIRKAKFEEVGELLNREQVLATTDRILLLLGLRDPNDNPKDGAAARMFLSIFLILGHPTHVLSKDGDQEQDLIGKASDLLTVFNRVIDGPFIASRSSSTSLSELGDSYSAFQSAFAAWRSQDSSFMVSGMVAQFVELDAIWQSVKDDRLGGIAEDYKEGIQHNQALVLARLKRLLGPEKAMQTVRDAIRKSRKTRAQKKRQSKVDDKPRQARTATDVSTTTSTQSQVQSSPQQASSLSNPAHLARSQLESASIMPPNRVVTHEIAINKEWKIDTEPKMAMRDEIVSSITSNLQDGLDKGLGDVWIPAMAEMIRERLLGLLTPGNSLHNLIGEALDPEMVATQVKHGSFSYDNFFSFMNTILPQLCAPVRDPEVKALATNPSENPVQQLARLYFIIDIIRLDMLNFSLQRLAPAILKESSGYESRCFNQEMEGKFPERALIWWANAVNRSIEEVMRRSPDTSLEHARKVTANKVYMHGLVELAVGTAPLDTDDLPETLLLDHSRLNRMRGDILRIVTVSSILLTAKNLLRRDVRSLWKAEAQRMWELPMTSSPAAFVSIVESRYALPPSTKQQLSSTISRLLSDARDGQSTHPVMKVLLKKIKAHVLARLSAVSAEERIRASTTATEVLGSGGLPEFVTRVGDMVTELQRVADVDREAHGDWYDKIAKRFAELEEAKEAATAAGVVEAS